MKTAKGLIADRQTSITTIYSPDSLLPNGDAQGVVEDKRSSPVSDNGASFGSSTDSGVSLRSNGGRLSYTPETPYSSVETLGSQASLIKKRKWSSNTVTVKGNQVFSEKQKKVMATFSSVNYAPTHSDVYLAWVRNHPHRRQWDRWCLMILIGIAIGIMAALMQQCLELLSKIKWTETENLAQEGDLWKCFGVTAAISIGYVSVSAILVAFVHPPAGGSGVPEVLSFLNGIIVHGTLSLKTLVVKFVGLVFAVSSGIPAAVHGPVIAMGAIIGAGIGQFKSRTLNIKPAMFSRFRNPEDRRSFTTAGVAAGVAAAFNAPVGGLLFAMEDLASFWGRQLSWQTFFCCGVATAVANIFKTGFTGFEYNKGLLGLFNLSLTTPVSMNIIILGPAVVIGIVGGILGAIFTRLNDAVARLRKLIISCIPHPVVQKCARVMEPILIVVVMAAIGVFVPTAFPCRRLPPGFNENKTMLHCGFGGEFNPEVYNCEMPPNEPEGTVYYSDVATLMYGSGTAFVNKLHQRDVHRVYGYQTLLALSAVYYLGTAWTAGSAIVGGTFIPLIITGGLLGRAAGVGCLELYTYISGSELPQEEFWNWLDPALFSILGSASLLGGVTRLTLAITVIVVEMSRDIDIIIPVIIANFVAKIVADSLSKPLYKYQLEMKTLPYLDPELTVVIEGNTVNLELYSVGDIMCQPVRTLQVVESVAALAKVLVETGHGGFPVVRYDDESRLELSCGLITRTELYVILCSDEVYNEERQGYTINPIVDYEEVSVDYLADHSAALERVRMYTKFQQYHNIYVNLEAYVNTSAPKIDAHYSLHRTYSLFRTLGLRHLMVTDLRNRVVGIVTRKDLMPFNVIEKLVGQEIRRLEDREASLEGDTILPAITISHLPDPNGNEQDENPNDTKKVSTPL